MLQTLYTVGYEGLSIDAFLSIIKSHKIKRLIDIRRRPISRKPGFSRTILSHSLNAVGIDYTHIVALGTPDDIRQELKQQKDYEVFFDKMDGYIMTQRSALKEALALALEQPSALLCFERNPEECHRLVVAIQIVKLSDLILTVEHIWL